jgi:M6 family metalloprotease-like protein
MRTRAGTGIPKAATRRLLLIGMAVLAATSIVSTLAGGRAAGSGGGRDVGADRARRVKDLGVALLQGPANADGERLLRDRARELETLVQEDPARGLDAALDDDALARLRRAYPAAADRLESRGRFQGPVESMVADDFAAGTARQVTWMTLGRERVQVRFAGLPPEGFAQATYAAVDGVRVGGSIAATSGEVIPAPDLGGGPAPALGGTCSTLGVQHAVVILVDYPGNPNPYTQAEARDSFFAATAGRSVDGFWREASYNRTSLTGDVFGPYMMSRSYSCDPGGPESLRADVLAAADADVDFSQYDRLFIVHPDNGSCFYGGLGTLACMNLSSPNESFTATTSWLRGDQMHFNRDYSVFIAGHEAGHNLGLSHALALYFDPNYQRGESLGLPGASGTLVGYGDPFSSMGRSTPTAYHYSAQDKLRIGWLDPGNVRTITSSDTVTIAPYELPSSSVQALRVKRGTDSSYLWLESRTSQGQYDCQPGSFAVCPGALGHYEYPNTVDPPGSFFSCPQCTTMIDFTPVDLNLQNAPLPPGNSWSDPYTGLSLTVSNVAGGLSVAAAFNPPLCNRPAQVALSPSSLTTTNGGHAIFQATITNPDDPSCLPATYALNSSVWPYTLSASTVTLQPGVSSSPITFNKTVPTATEQGVYTVSLFATRAGVTGTGTAQVTVNSTCVLGDPVATLSPASQSVAVNETARFDLSVRSTDSAGCGSHQYLLASTQPAGWGGTITPSFFNLAGGQIGHATVSKFFPAGTQPGQTSLVDAIATSAPGTPPASPHVGSATAQLTAAAPCVHANPTLVTVPGGQIGSPGDQVAFDGQVTSHDSPTCAPVLYTINVSGPAGWEVFPVSDCIPACPPQILVPPGQTGHVTYGATLPPSLPPGSGYTIHMNATSANGFGSTFGLVGVDPICINQAPTVVLTPSTSPANAGQPAAFTVTVTNNDFGSQCTAETFSLAAGVPAGWAASLSASVSVAPGASVQVPFAATSPVATASGSYQVAVTASGGSGVGTGGGLVQVSAVCLRGSGPVVTLSPDALEVAAGQSAAFVVTLLDNDQGAACTGYDVTFQTVEPSGFGHAILPSSVFVPPHGNATATYTLIPDTPHAGGTFTVLVNAFRGNSIGDDSTGSAAVRVEPLRTLEAGYGHSISVHPDGTAWDWGWNQDGQLGDGTSTNRNGPVRAGSLTGVIEAGAGVFHSAALRSDGTVWTWGGNSKGQLGDGTTASRSTPGAVSSLSGIVAVVAGFSHGLALKSDGTVWAWGDNTSGQLGDGTTVDRPVPVQVPGLSAVAAIAAGAYHSVALKSDGTIWTWGSNAEGQLGDGTHTDRPAPGPVPGLSGAVRASCGAYFSMVVLADGSVKGWGHNFYGQLGDGSTDERTLPVAASLPGGITDIAAGSGFTLALRSDGSVWSFGQNVFGELGDGTTANRSTPQAIAGLGGIVAIAAGEDHSLARDGQGRLYGWGKNLYGQIGNGPSPQTTPIVVVDESQPAPLGLIAPVGGEVWQPGSAQVVSWTGAGPVSVRISLDAGASYTTLVASTSLQDVPITVPANWTTARGRLRIDRVGMPASFAQTGAYIRIHPTPQHPWLAMTVDATPQVTGEYASTAIDRFGRTGIAYFDRTNGDLKFALRTGTTWTLETVDATNSSGWYTSLAFGADGSPRIAYMDGTRTFLRYASKASGAWTREDVADTGCTLPASLAFDTADRPFIAIQDCATTRVRVFARSTSWSEIRVQSGASPSLRMAGNLPRVSYFLHTTSPTQLHLLSASGTFGSFTWTDEVVPGGDGAGWNSLAVDAQGTPWVAFYEAGGRSLRLAKKTGGAWSVEVVDATAGDVGNWNSIALDASSRPRISYLANGLVKVAEWSGSAWQIDAVDSSGDTPAATAIAVDAAGNDRVAYFDTPGGDLRDAISQPDVTAPASPALVLGAGRSTIAVSWTAPGDDGSNGTASLYDLRRSASPITDANFPQATVVPTGSPAPAGVAECAGVQSLPRCTRQYFALRVLDDLGNASLLSFGQITTNCGGLQEVFCN